MLSFGDVAWRVLQMRIFDGIRPNIVRSDAYLLMGRTCWSDSFSTFVLGSKLSVEYFSKLFYVGEPKVKFLGRIALSKILSFVDESCVDLMVVESTWFFSRFFREIGFFISPRLDFVLEIHDHFESILERMQDGKRRRFKQVANSAYNFEVTKDPTKLEVFYHNLYLPHMIKKHSSCASPLSFSECKELFNKGMLILIKSGDTLISGSVLIPKGDELWEPILGVKDVDNGLHFTLASYAIYHFNILVGIQRGFARMDFGEAPPFMSDGLFQFKKGLGMWVRPARGDSAQVFGVRFCGGGESGRRFLATNPFVFMDGEGLSGVVFLEHLDIDSVTRYCVPGLSSLYVITPSLNGCLNDIKGVKVLSNVCVNSQSKVISLLGDVCAKGQFIVYQIPL